jgi:NAD+ diphosphatase
MRREDAALWGTARSLIEWHNRHRFCGELRHADAPFRAGWGRKCGLRAEHFPRVDPVVIMLAEHDGRVLLGRQPQYPPGRYSALAGFVEPGESIEEAVARELGEEAGIEVERRPLRRQPALALSRPADDRLHRRAPPTTRSRSTGRAGGRLVGGPRRVEAALAGDPGRALPRAAAFRHRHTCSAHWLDGLEPLAPARPR